MLECDIGQSVIWIQTRLIVEKNIHHRILFRETRLVVLTVNDISESTTKTHTTEEDELDRGRVQQQQQILNLSPNEVDKRKHMKQCETYRATEKARYAIKHIKDTYFRDNDPESYIQAAR